LPGTAEQKKTETHALTPTPQKNQKNRILSNFTKTGEDEGRPTDCSNSG
jgi:hypothetical protein